MNRTYKNIFQKLFPTILQNLNLLRKLLRNFVFVLITVEILILNIRFIKVLISSIEYVL